METEVLVRFVVVAIAAGAVVFVARYRPARRPARLNIDGNLVGPGVFLFTSEACDSCEAARQIYVEVLGADGFVEHSWEESPGLLTRLGVEEIPVGTVIDAAGKQVAAFRLLPDRRALGRAVRRLG